MSKIARLSGMICKIERSIFILPVMPLAILHILFHHFGKHRRGMQGPNDKIIFFYFIVPIVAPAALGHGIEQINDLTMER